MGTLPQPAAATLKNLHKFVRLISLLFEGRVRYRLYPQRNELKSPCRYLDIYIHGAGQVVMINAAVILRPLRGPTHSEVSIRASVAARLPTAGRLVG